MLNTQNKIRAMLSERVRPAEIAPGVWHLGCYRISRAGEGARCRSTMGGAATRRKAVDSQSAYFHLTSFNLSPGVPAKVLASPLAITDSFGLKERPVTCQVPQAKHFRLICESNAT